MPAFLVLIFLCLAPARASEPSPILAAAETVAREMAAGQPGEIRVEAGPIDSSRLPACSQLETLKPETPRNIGRVYVGVRCLAPTEWNILVPVRISVIADHVVTRRALLAGRVVQAGDIGLGRGDLGQLPTGTLLSTEQALGKTLRNSLGAGQPVRADQLRVTPVIRQGQTVKVVTRGKGFAARADGKALNTAGPGEVARARMPSGRTISGIAQQDGSILLSN